MIIFVFIFIGDGLSEAIGNAPYCSPKFSIAASPVRIRRFIDSQLMKFINTFSASITKNPPLAL